MKSYIGIDNGVSGTIGIISEGKTYFFKTPVKVEQNYTKTKSNVTRIDVLELDRLLQKFENPFAVLERPMVNPKRFKATTSALRALEATITFLEASEIGFVYCDSKAWQRELLPKGVKGADPSGIYKNNPNKQGEQRAPNSPYSYKTKMPPPSKLDKWSVRRGVAPRDAKGRFLPRRSVNFAIAKSIFHQGLRPTFFFTKAYKKYLTTQFELDFMLAYSKDVEENL